MTNRQRSRLKHDGPLAGGVARPPVRRPFGRLVRDSYLTDGRHLLRVVSSFEAGARDVFATLEDCLTLEVRAYLPSELSAMRHVGAPTAGA